MSAARWLESQGIRVWAKDDALTLEGLSALTPENEAKVLDYARQNKTRLLEELRAPVALAWPMPESGHLAIYSAPWKYACLFALASHFGAVLTHDTRGVLGLVCPATMPQDAVHAAQEGLNELGDYMRERVQQMTTFGY